MLNRDIEELFNVVPIGTSVVIRRSPADESDAADVQPVEGRPRETQPLTLRSTPRDPTVAEKPAPKPMAKVAEPKIRRKKRYTIQVAALIIERNALALTTRLKKLGYTPGVHTTTARIMRHRVYGGEFTSREEADQTARRLNVDGFPSHLVESGGGKFGLEVGSFFKLDAAIDLARDLQKKNYASKIVSNPIPTPIHAVRIGQYHSRSEALETLAVITKEGLNPLVVRR